MKVKKILLVEDDIDIRENMVFVLNYEGYKVLQAENGAEALKVLENEMPEMILLDLFMPVMNGREFLDALHSHAQEELRKIPVVLVTASEQNAHLDLEKRVLAVVRKPIDLKAFLGIIETLEK
jgi:CheY-like chemotaxis protein